jgi:hypothetical protein
MLTKVRFKSTSDWPIDGVGLLYVACTFIGFDTIPPVTIKEKYEVLNEINPDHKSRTCFCIMINVLRRCNVYNTKLNLWR